MLMELSGAVRRGRVSGSILPRPSRRFPYSPQISATVESVEHVNGVLMERR